MSSLFHFVLCICKDIFLSKKKEKKDLSSNFTNLQTENNYNKLCENKFAKTKLVCFSLHPIIFHTVRPTSPSCSEEW